MDSPIIALLKNHPIYHTTPLHYLPLILLDGELRAQRLLGTHMGRPTARRRDRFLEVDQYVHCSLRAKTPMLIHKLAKGFPHAVLEFDSDGLIGFPVAILPCSTKAWRSRWQCAPISDVLEIDRLLRHYFDNGRFRGLEVLIKEKFPLLSLRAIHIPSEEEASVVRSFCRDLCNGFDRLLVVDRHLAESSYRADNLAKIAEYYNRLVETKTALAPPALQFD